MTYVVNTIPGGNSRQVIRMAELWTSVLLERVFTLLNIYCLSSRLCYTLIDRTLQLTRNQLDLLANMRSLLFEC
jgi:hypothetical protein